MRMKLAVLMKLTVLMVLMALTFSAFSQRQGPPIPINPPRFQVVVTLEATDLAVSDEERINIAFGVAKDCFADSKVFTLQGISVSKLP